MLGVEVFRDKQGLGQKRSDGEKDGKEEGEDAAEKDEEQEEERAADKETELENGNENGSSESKTDCGDKETSSWEREGDRNEKGLTDVSEL